MTLWCVDQSGASIIEPRDEPQPIETDDKTKTARALGAIYRLARGRGTTAAAQRLASIALGNAQPSARDAA